MGNEEMKKWLLQGRRCELHYFSKLLALATVRYMSLSVPYTWIQIWGRCITLHRQVVDISHIQDVKVTYTRCIFNYLLDSHPSCVEIGL